MIYNVLTFALLLSSVSGLATPTTKKYRVAGKFH